VEAAATALGITGGKMQEMGSGAGRMADMGDFLTIYMGDMEKEKRRTGYIRSVLDALKT
jgi:hypothetical protein